MTNDLEGRKPSRSGLGKAVLPSSGDCGTTTLRSGDNQADPQLNVPTPGGQLGAACGALSAKDGAEAGSIPAQLGASAINGREHVRAMSSPISTPRQRHKLFDNDFLRDLRERNGLTLEELAARVDSSKSHIWELENGRTEPSFSLAYKLAAALGCDLRLFAKNARSARDRPNAD